MNLSFIYLFSLLDSSYEDILYKQNSIFFFFFASNTRDKQKTEFTSSCLGGTTVAAVSMKGLAEETVFGFSLPIGETWQ